MAVVLRHQVAFNEASTGRRPPREGSPLRANELLQHLRPFFKRCSCTTSLWSLVAAASLFCGERFCLGMSPSIVTSILCRPPAMSCNGGGLEALKRSYRFPCARTDCTLPQGEQSLAFPVRQNGLCLPQPCAAAKWLTRAETTRRQSGHIARGRQFHRHLCTPLPPTPPLILHRRRPLGQAILDGSKREILSAVPQRSRLAPENSLPLPPNRGSFPWKGPKLNITAFPPSTLAPAEGRMFHGKQPG